MTRLDLTIHGPEEYQGKTVIWKGGEYEVGDYLGMGAERIVHKLRNGRSGLSLLVLKIWRSADLGYVPSEAYAEMRRAIRESGAPFEIPFSVEIELPGGRGELQLLVGHDDGDVDETLRALEADAFRALKADNLEQAEQQYRALLEKQPTHTRGMLNLAAVHAKRGQFAAAFHLADQARSIEPNFPAYHIAVMDYLDRQGLARLAQMEFTAAKQHFPNTYAFDHLGVRYHLECGELDAAAECAASADLDPNEKRDLLQVIRDARTAREQASEHVRTARAALESNADPKYVLVELEKARSIDQSDPMVAINLGFARARSGNSEGAVPLLLEALHRCRLELATCVVANAAFALVESRGLTGAMPLLQDLMRRLLNETDGLLQHHPAYHEPDRHIWADLPGKGVWADGLAVREEALPSAAALLKKAVMEYDGNDEVPDDVKELVTLYVRQAAVYFSRVESTGTWTHRVSQAIRRAVQRVFPT